MSGITGNKYAGKLWSVDSDGLSKFLRLKNLHTLLMKWRF